MLKLPLTLLMLTLAACRGGSTTQTDADPRPATKPFAFSPDVPRLDVARKFRVTTERRLVGDDAFDADVYLIATAPLTEADGREGSYSSVTLPAPVTGGELSWRKYEVTATGYGYETDQAAEVGVQASGSEARLLATPKAVASLTQKSEKDQWLEVRTDLPVETAGSFMGLKPRQITAHVVFPLARELRWPRRALAMESDYAFSLREQVPHASSGKSIALEVDLYTKECRLQNQTRAETAPCDFVAGWLIVQGHGRLAIAPNVDPEGRAIGYSFKGRGFEDILVPR